MSAPPSSGVQPTYLVRLGADGQWIWRNTPSGKFTADWYNKFPPESTPRFLVDLGPGYESLDPDSTTGRKWPWKVVHVPTLYLDDFSAAEVLMKQGWGTLSYQWGEFLPTTPYKHRPVWPNRTDQNLPLPYIPPNSSVEMADGYDWGIPKLEVRIPIDGIKKAMKALKVRFVWWDAACIPQRDFSGGFSQDKERNPPFAGPPWLPGDLGDIAGDEVSKQKFVYQKASVGAVWLNQVVWANASALRRVMEKTPLIINVDAVRTMLVRELNGTVKASENQAGVILATVMKDFTGTGVEPKSDAEWRTAISSFRDTLLEVRKNDGWFRSLWSFQEGRLLTNQAFIDGTGNPLDLKGKTYDEEGNPISFPYTRYQLGDGSFQTANFPSIRELSAFVTILATQISIAYTKAYGSGIGFPIDDLVKIWKDVTKKDNNGNDDSGKKFLEAVMRDLTGTGLLFNSDEAPLELLLAARRTRFPSLFYRDEYLAMTGVLDLNKYDDGPRDYSLKDPTKGQGYWNDDDKNKKWLYEELPKSMFQALVKRFQWHCLMFAKRTVDDVNHWGAISMGHYETINCYCAQMLIKSEFAVERKDWRYVLPQLEYLPASDEVKLTPPAGSLGGVKIAGSTVVKTIPAFYITCYAVTRDWSDQWVNEGKADAKPPQMMGWTLGEQAIPYEDDEYIKNGFAKEITTRTPKHSNPVLTKAVQCQPLMKLKYDSAKDKQIPANMTGKSKPSDKQLNPWLLIPFECLDFDLVTPASVSPGITKAEGNDAAPTPATPTTKAGTVTEQPVAETWYKLNQRCVLITDVRADGTVKEGLHFKATFRGIVDCTNIIAKPSYYSDIRLKWQADDPVKPEEKKPQEPDAKDTKAPQVNGVAPKEPVPTIPVPPPMPDPDVYTKPADPIPKVPVM